MTPQARAVLVAERKALWATVATLAKAGQPHDHLKARIAELRALLR